MKKNIFTVVLLLSVCGAGYCANQYYCPEPDGSYYSLRDVYNPKENCNDFKDEFFGRDAYGECLANIKKAKQKYLQGKCEPIIVKTHVFGSCKGEVEFAQKSKQVLGFYTHGGDCMNKLKSLYKDYKY